MNNPGIKHVCTGVRSGILAEVADRGLAFVSEQSCIDLLIDLGKPLPKEDPKGGDRKIVLAMCCLMALQPGWSHIQVSRALSKSFILEHPDCYDDPLLPDDIVDDLCNNNDARYVKKKSMGLGATEETRVAKHNARLKYLRKYFPSADSLKKRTFDKSAPRFFPKKQTVTKDATAWLRELMPESVGLQEDDIQGRWYVVFSQRLAAQIYFVDAEGLYLGVQRGLARCLVIPL